MSLGGQRSGVSATVTILAVIIVLIIAGAGGYLVGLSQTTTVTSTTTSIATTTLPPSVITTTDTVTTTPAVPLNVTISGNFKTNGTGTYAMTISFISQSSGITYPGKVSAGTYSINVPNQTIYTVKVDYTAIPVGGTCTAGSLPAYIQFPTTITASWSC
jgi:hypothetical protein